MTLVALLGAACAAPAVFLDLDATPDDTGADDTDTATDTDTGPPPPVDADGDGFDVDVDCDDADPGVHPGALEACDGIDQDCSGEPDEDACLCPTSELFGHVYQLCADDTVEWLEARSLCDATGTDLVVLDDSAEAAWLAERLRVSSFPRTWWLGLTDEQDEGQWLWVDGTSLDFEAWARGEPNDWRGGEDCAEIRSWDAAWNDTPCRTALPFVCESF